MSLHRGGVVGRRAEREVGQLPDGHPDDREQREHDDLEDGEVDRRQQAPQPVPERGRGCSGRTVGWRPPRRPPASRWLEPLDGGGRRTACRARPRRARRERRRREVRLQVLEILQPDRHPQQARGDPGREQLGLVDWRCEVDGGWTTIVWTLPSEAVRSGSRRASMTRPAGVAAAVDLEGEHPAGDARPELARATSCCGWLGRPG